MQISGPALPPIDDAASLAAGSSVAMSEVARAEPSDESIEQMRRFDSRLGGGGNFSDPARFAYQAACSYLMCAGDFVSGLQYVVRPGPNLHFSSGSLARSACEYANRASWIADPQISDEQRVARAIAVFAKAIQEEQALLDPAVLADLRQLISETDRWRTRHSFRETAKVPYPTQLFAILDPVGGRESYRRLSNSAHGSFLSMVITHDAAIRQDNSVAAETWWRVLTACRYGIVAADRINALQGVHPPESLANCWTLIHHLWAMCEEWENAASIRNQ